MNNLNLILKKNDDYRILNKELKQFFYETYYERKDENELRTFVSKAYTERITIDKYKRYPYLDGNTELILSIKVSFWGEIDYANANITWTIERVLVPTRYICAILMILYERYDWFRSNKAYTQMLSEALNTMSSCGHISCTDEMCQDVIDIGTRVKPYEFAKNHSELSPHFTTYMAHLDYDLFFPDNGEIW